MSLIVDLDTLMGRDGKRCELARTGTILPETARRILCDAGISRFIVQGDSVPLDMGRQVRTATSAQRQALSCGTPAVPTRGAMPRPSGATFITSPTGWMGAGPTSTT